MVKIVLLNGPPRVGKDFSGEILRRGIPSGVWRKVVKFAYVVKDGVHAAYQVRDAEGQPVDYAYFEDTKDLPEEKLFGITPRAAYIAFSEAFMKPLHGPRIFGIMLREQMINDLARKLVDYSGQDPVFIVTDSGFTEEAEVLVERFGAGNCFLVRLHPLGEDPSENGGKFAGDSRGWVDLSHLGVASLDVVNPMTPEGLEAALAPVIEWIRQSTST